MQHIERAKLYTDLQYRFNYVAKFVNFGEEDIQAIKNSSNLIVPLLKKIVDTVYVKLFSFDITKDVFAKRNEGFTGRIDSSSSLNLNSDQIAFRKDMLTKYLTKLVTADYNEQFIRYLDRVGKIHTPKAGAKGINVEYIHVNALFGYVTDVLFHEILNSSLDEESKRKTVLAFNKLLWIQNDLFARHYVNDGDDITGIAELPALGDTKNNGASEKSFAWNPLYGSALSLAVGVFVGFVYHKSQY